MKKSYKSFAKPGDTYYLFLKQELEVSKCFVGMLV
jgi:hypothetical protein